MARIAFLLLCHKRADRVLEQVRILTSGGDYVVVHADANAGPEFRAAIALGIADNARAALARSERCGWGEWSLVQASLNMAKTALDTFADASHFFLMSGDCMPVKPGRYIRERLENDQTDWIEHADFMDDDWIKTGLKEDRLIYRHWFNERTRKWWFYTSLNLQRRLGWTRQIPKGLRVKIGSQWWVLRRATLEKVMAFTKARRDVMRFFRTTWIPDETFFQTIVMAVTPRVEVISRPPTFLMFSDYGMPVTFCADHYGLLKSEDAFFARKISSHDDALRRSLGELFESDDEIETTTTAGRTHYDFVRSRGREGRRFAPRIWEAGAMIGPERAVSLVICKKWHIGKRIIEELRGAGGGVPGFAYVFDEDDAWLPPMGNFEGSREKRSRHRRAFLRLLFEDTGADRIAFCLDPSNLDAIRDLMADGCEVRILDVRCDISDDWLSGHGERIGLGSPETTGALHGQLLTTLRNTIEAEVRAIRHLGLAGYRSIAEGETPGQMARPIAEALGLSVDQGAKIARRDGLFD